LRFLTIILCAALVCPAQQVSGPKSTLVQPGGVKIVVVEGEGAVNNIRTKVATQPVVEIRDDNDKPIPGAEVIFQLPAAGPGGVFNGWMRNQTARSNAEGRAGTNGFVPNDEAGRFNIKVTATVGTKSTSAIIAQSNGSGAGNGKEAKSSRATMWKVLAIVGAGALAGGIYAGTRGGDSASSTAAAIPVSASAGPISVAGPR
jgi:hypothetical protein